MIVENDLPPRGIDQTAEIAFAHGHRGHWAPIVLPARRRKSSRAAKKKVAVSAVVQLRYDDRPADGAAVFVANQLWRLDIEILAAPCYSEAVILTGV